MFLIMGINSGRKQLNFDQSEICKSCGSYGHIEVFMTYTYFMLFFIPLFKWNRHYFIRMTCCGATCEISEELGKEIANGNVISLNMEQFDFGHGQADTKRCTNCGYTTSEDYEYCPKCGKQF